MSRSIVRRILHSAAIVALLLVSACASRQVRCDRHLVPINVPQSKTALRDSK